MPPFNIDLISRIPELTWYTEGAKKYLSDPVRKKRVVAQPEEIVRQCILHYLIHTLHVNPSRISVEKGFNIAHKQRRIDICIYDERAQPYLLVECKAPSIAIVQAHADQISVYNQYLNAPFLWLSNGHQNHLFKVSADSVKAMNYNPLEG